MYCYRVLKNMQMTAGTLKVAKISEKEKEEILAM